MGGNGQTSWSDATKYSTSSNITDSTTGQLTLLTTSGWCNNASCNSSWKYRKKITFNNTDANLGVTSENLVNFPVLVKLSSLNIDYTKTQDSGQDIRFTDTDGSDLAYEIEKWDETGTSWVWVKVPQIDINSSTDYIYLYYGNTSATDHQQATSVWNSNYKGVWHLSENPAGTAPQMLDSTSNDNDGTSAGAMTSEDQVVGQVDGSLDFDGGNDHIDAGSGIPLDSNNWTLHIWASIVNASVPYKRLLSYYGDGPTIWKTNSSGSLSIVHSAIIDFNMGITLVPGEWTALTVTRAGSTIIAYKNGIQTAQNTNFNAAYTANTSVRVGNSTAYNEPFNGTIDEVRISNTATSAAWIAASYKSETDAFNTFNSEEERYTSSGALTSSIFDTEQQSNWGTLTYNTDGVATTIVKARTSNSSSMTGATDFTSCNTIVSGSDISSNNCITDTHRYIQYQISLASTSANTPTFQDISITFTVNDTSAPAITLTALSPDPNNDNTPSLSGSATDIGGTVSNVQFQIDGTSGSWTACTADDGSFNSTSEAFTCTVSSALSDGSHTMYIRATDSNGNTTSDGSATTDTFTITTLSRINTPEEEKTIEQDLKELPKKEQEKVKEEEEEELEITKQVEPSASANFFSSLMAFMRDLFNSIVNGIQIAFNWVGSEIQFAFNTTGNALAFVGRGIDNTLAFVGQELQNGVNAVGQGLASAGEKIGQGVSAIAQGTGNMLASFDQGIANTEKAIGDGYNQLANNAPGVTKIILIGIGNGVSTTVNFIASTASTIANTTAMIAQNTASTIRHTANTVFTTTNTIATNTEKAITGATNYVVIGTTTFTKKAGLAIASATQNGVNNTKNGVANLAFTIGKRTENISHGVGTTIIKIGYLFVPEPTKISDVTAVILSPTSVKISWKTNHPANAKVNWGYEDGIYEFEQLTDKRISQHEFILTNLKPDTEYHYEVMSQNRNYVYDANRKFKTPAK